MGNPYKVKPQKKGFRPGLDNKGFTEEIEIKPEDLIDAARKDADKLRKDAEEEIGKLYEQAQEEILKRLAQVEQEAMEQGYKKGEEEALKKHEDIIKEAEFIREHSKIEYNQVLSNLEGEVISIILDIVKKVITTELVQNQDIIKGQVIDAFANCSSKDTAVLRVSEKDYDLIIDSKDEIINIVEGLKDLTVEKDLSLKTGHCIIDTPYGCIDSDVESKFEQIENEFLKIAGLKG